MPDLGLLWCPDSVCGAWALECAGSVVVTPSLSCPAARETLLPRPGNLTTGPPGKSLNSNFLKENHLEYVHTHGTRSSGHLSLWHVLLCFLESPNEEEQSPPGTHDGSAA